MQPSSGVRGVSNHPSRGSVAVSPDTSPLSYEELTSLYPAEEGSSDEELKGPKILDDKAPVRVPQHSPVGMTAQSPPPDGLERMATTSLNYFSRPPGARNQSPSRLSSSKADDHDIEAASRMTTAPTAMMARNDYSFPGAAVSTRHTLQNVGMLKLVSLRNPEEWMTVDDTVGLCFLWYTVVLQLAAIITTSVYLHSAHYDQISWKVGCWGSWTALSSAEGVEWVIFDTQVGWKLYGKEPYLASLKDVDHGTAIVGALSGGMHGIILTFACGFFLFSVATLSASYFMTPPCGEDWSAVVDSEEKDFDGLGAKFHEKQQKVAKRVIGRTGTAGTGRNVNQIEWHTVEDPDSLKARLRRLMLGRSCHPWLLSMGTIMVFCGLWCVLLGCVAFYLLVTTDFTRGLKAILSGWGTDVSCTDPDTRPLLGFYANGVAAFVLIGGGSLCALQAIISERELRKMVRMWDAARADMAEVQARSNLLKKRQAHSNAVTTAAAAVAAVGSSSSSSSRRSEAPYTAWLNKPDFSESPDLPRLLSLDEDDNQLISLNGYDTPQSITPTPTAMAVAQSLDADGLRLLKMPDSDTTDTNHSGRAHARAPYKMPARLGGMSRAESQPTIGARGGVNVQRSSERRRTSGGGGSDSSEDGAPFPFG